MIGEHGIVHQSKPESFLAGREACAQRAIRPGVPKGRQSLLQAHRHVQGIVPRERGSLCVRRSLLRILALRPSGSRSWTTPSAWKGKLVLNPVRLVLHRSQDRKDSRSVSAELGPLSCSLIKADNFGLGAGNRGIRELSGYETRDYPRRSITSFNRDRALPRAMCPPPPARRRSFRVRCGRRRRGFRVRPCRGRVRGSGSLN